MKKILLLSFVFLNLRMAEAQQQELPAAYLKDSLPEFVHREKDLLDRAYMAPTLLGTTDTLPG